MRLRNLGANMTELMVNGVTVLFSYNTPVAGRDENGYFRTNEFWSRTTTKHINKWLDGVNARIESQRYIEELVK